MTREYQLMINMYVNIILINESSLREMDKVDII